MEMAIRCEKVKELLGRFYDHELHGREFAAVSEHLRGCDSCSGELEKLEQVGRMLKAHYEDLAAAENLSQVWNGVSATIEAPPVHEPEPLLDRFIRLFSLPKPAWAAVAAVALALILVLAYLPGNNVPTLAADDCIIDRVDAEGCSVMVYEVGDTKMKVIWVMEQQNGPVGENTGVAS